MDWFEEQRLREGGRSVLKNREKVADTSVLKSGEKVNPCFF